MAEYYRGYEDGLDLAASEVCQKCHEKLQALLERLRDRRRFFQKGRILASQE